MTKNMKKITAFLLSLAIVMSMSSMVFATSGFDVNFVSKDTANVSGDISNITGGIIFIVQMVGYAVATVMLLVLAIKYISASPNDKADIKKSAVTYVVGALILFGASFLLGIIKDFGMNLGK